MFFCHSFIRKFITLLFFFSLIGCQLQEPTKNHGIVFLENRSNKLKIDVSNSLGMDVLVETHNEEEVHRAISLKASLIGINNRNLKTLEIDLNNTIKLSKLIPDSCDIICESGLNNNNDLKDMEKIGIMRFLVGESLMKSDNIELATKELIKR